jgi:hypothetical protein
MISILAWLIDTLNKQTIKDDINSKLKDFIIEKCLANG